MKQLCSPIQWFEPYAILRLGGGKLQQRLPNYVSCHLRIFTLSYSYRNATIGSTFVARRAGR